MSAVACQPSLFAELDLAGGAGFSARPRVARRGRGAVAVRRITVRLRTRNVAGRSKLLFAYRPLKTWNAATLRLVHGLLERYFARIGGFRVARDSTVRTWYEALASGMYTADELRWAIDAKAASLVGDTPAETRAKRRRFVYGPGRFLDSAGYWLAQSPEYKARVDGIRAGELEGSAARLAAARDAAVRRGLDDIKAGGVRRAADRGEQRDSAAAHRAALWGSLSPARRAVALQATERAFRERCEQWGMAPDSPELVQLRVDYATNSAASK